MDNTTPHLQALRQSVTAAHASPLIPPAARQFAAAALAVIELQQQQIQELQQRLNPSKQPAL